MNNLKNEAEGMPMKKSATTNNGESMLPIKETGKFFSIWFFIAILLILVGLVIATNVTSSPTVGFIVSLAANLFQSIGVAILIANIFSFIIGTEQFVDYIRKKLIGVVVSKDFITKLNPEEQRELLKMVLKPTKELSKIYSGINDYFDRYIDDSMVLFDTTYRGHMVIDAVAKYDEGKQRVKIEICTDYIVYKVADKFEPLRLLSEDDSFEHIKTTLSGPSQSEFEIKHDAVSAVDELSDPSMKKGYVMEVPEEFNKYNHINVSRKCVEYGNDHWQVFSYKTIKPCHRVTLKLRCEGDLVVKNSNTYGVEDRFSIEKDEKSIKITYNDWLSPGFGASIVVAKNTH